MTCCRQSNLVEKNNLQQLMVVLHLLKRIIYLEVQRRRFVLSNYVNVGRQAKHKMGTILTNLRLTSRRRSKKVISTCTSYEFFLNLLMWVETIGLEVVRTKNFCNDTLNCSFSTLTNYIFFLSKKKRGNSISRKEWAK